MTIMVPLKLNTAHVSQQINENSKKCNLCIQRATKFILNDYESDYRQRLSKLNATIYDAL